MVDVMVVSIKKTIHKNKYKQRVLSVAAYTKPRHIHKTHVEIETLQVLQILSSVTLMVNQVLNCLKLSTCSQTMSHLCLCISLYFRADRYLKKIIKKSTSLLDKYKLVYPEILANWEHSFEH